MANIRETRRRLLTILIVLLVVDAVAAGILFSPIGRGSSARRQRLTGMHTELQQKTREAVPLEGIDGKIETAHNQIGHFYADRFSAKYSDVATELGKLAAENRVQLLRVDYPGGEEQLPGLRRVPIKASVAGTYTNIVRFINAVERSKLFFLIDGITLGGAQEGRVNLTMELETFLKSEAL